MDALVAVLSGRRGGGVTMRRVQIISPFRGQTPAEQRRNVAYAQAAMLDCLGRDEAPFAPHLLYPAVLDESEPEQRAQGIVAGVAWLVVAECVAVYEDLGVSEGMRAELRAAAAAGVHVERRSLPGWAFESPVLCPHNVARRYPCLLCAVSDKGEMP